MKNATTANKTSWIPIEQWPICFTQGDYTTQLHMDYNKPVLYKDPY